PTAPPPPATPRRASAATRARAADKCASGRATLSTRVFLPSATVPSARMLQPPPVRKKLSPIVEVDSEATVRARFSNVIMPRSGDQVITGGASTPEPGSMRKSTLLSWKPSPDTGAAYDQVRSQALDADWIMLGWTWDPRRASFTG